MSSTAVRGFASHVVEGAHNRAIEAKLAELKAEQARLMNQLSAPRAARLREMDKAAAYGLVLEDVNRLVSRGKATRVPGVDRLEDIAKFAAHRREFLK